MAAFPGYSQVKSLYLAAETGVFWDVEDCTIPDEFTADEVLQMIRSRLSDYGHYGTVTIRAYGDMTGLNFPSGGIKLNHFPAGQRQAKHTQMLQDIISWAEQHPEPSTLMLMMADTDHSDEFMLTIELLKAIKSYRLLYVCPE